VFGALSRRPARSSLAPANFFARIHRSAALACTAVADGLVVAAVVKTIVVGDLFAGSDVANRRNPHAPPDFPRFAVGIATMIDEHCRAVAIDDDRAVSESKQIGNGRVLVCCVGFFLGEARPRVFGYAHAFTNRGRGIAARGVDGRRANDETHKLCDAFLWGIGDLYGLHRTIEVTMMDEPIAKRIGVSPVVNVRLAVGCFCLAFAPLAVAQGVPGQSDKQVRPPASAQQTPPQKPGDRANPFPEDTSNIPVVPTNGEPVAVPSPPAASDDDNLTTSLLREDTDPVKSPDDPTAGSPDSGGFSSSSQGGDEVNIPSEPDRTSKHQKQAQPEPTRQETAKDDESVGAYYLDRKNWKAALSRFESALVLDPENPDVYWGLAEAQRQLGDFSNAKANYQKVTVYDPDSKHSKEAKKYLKMPEIANAPAAAANRPAAQPQQ